MLFEKFSLGFVFGGLLWSASMGGMAQPAGTLYDPEPPADSAYVRVVTAGHDERIDVNVDGKLRVKSLKSGAASDYMVLEAGSHVLAIRTSGKTQDRVTTTVDVARGSAITIGFPAVKPDSKPTVFLDKTNSNKLKALLAIYHLDPNIGAVNVSSADGKTRVFSDLVYGRSESVQVNPISIDLLVATGGDGVARGRPALTMTQGGSYSVFLLPSGNQKFTTHVQESKVEKYTKLR